MTGQVEDKCQESLWKTSAKNHCGRLVPRITVED